MSGHSVRGFLGRRFKSLDLLVKRVSKNFCHVIVEPQPDRDGSFASKLAIRGGTNPVAAEADDMLAPPKAGADHTVDGHVFPVGQVYKECLIGAAYHQTAPSLENLILLASAQPVQPIRSERVAG